MAALKLFPQLRNIEVRKLEAAEKHFEQIDVAPGTVLYNEGDVSDKIYFLYFGQVVLVSEDKEGLLVELAHVVDVGANLGEEILFKPVRNRTSTAIVLKEAHLLSLTRSAWEKVSKILKSTAGGLKVGVAHKEQLEHVVGTYQIFRSISKMRQNQFTSVCTINHFPPGQRIVRRNNRKHQPRFYVITSGVARVYLDDVVVRELKSGDYFGEISVITDLPPTATVVAYGKKECTCLSIPKRFFRALFQDEPGIMSEFFIRKDGSAIDLEYVLNHEVARNAYLQYSKGIYANENVEFWQAVDSLERTDQRMKESDKVFTKLNIKDKNEERARDFLEKRVNWIVETWVTDEAQNEVSMSHEVKQDLLKRNTAKDFSFDMFAEAKQFVLGLMGSNYRDFTASEEFDSLLQSMNIYEFDD